MKLYNNWRTIVRKSWALKFMAIAAVAQTAQIVLPLYVDELPRETYAVLILLAIVGGMVARVVHQEEI